MSAEDLINDDIEIEGVDIGDLALWLIGKFNGEKRRGRPTQNRLAELVKAWNAYQDHEDVFQDSLMQMLAHLDAHPGAKVMVDDELFYRGFHNELLREIAAKILGAILRREISPAQGRRMYEAAEAAAVAGAEVVS